MLTGAINGSRQNKQHPKALHSQEVLMCINEDRSHDCADSDTDTSSDRVQWSYLTVLTAPLFLSLSVVSFHNHKGRQHSNSSPTEGRHDGVHMGQLTRQVHHLDEFRVCGSCIHIFESLNSGVLPAVCSLL